MPKVNLWVAVTVVAGVVAVGSIRAQTQEGTGSSVQALTGQDYEQIEELYARYNQGSDFRDAELFLSAFAEDAVMTRGGRVIAGMAALRAERVERYAGETGDNGRRHHNASSIITATASGAKARAYWMLFDVSIRPPTPVGSGYYDDTFTRTSQGWRIQTRTLTSDESAR
jgi:hypothetical protein